MAAMRFRLMPEGVEWLRFEDGEPVPPGGEVTVAVHDEDGDFDRTFAIRSIKYKESCVLLEGTKNEMVALSHGERVKRPAPKVLDADGEEIREGDTVWNSVGTAFTVCAVNGDKSSFDAVRGYDGQKCPGLNPAIFTHRAPVLAADRRPLHEGETVWDVETGTELVVKGLPKPGEYQAVVVFAPPASQLTSFDPDRLTHERPDSWGRLEEDARKGPSDYWGCGEDPCSECPSTVDGKRPRERYGVVSCANAKPMDLVRRARALAERDAR